MRVSVAFACLIALGCARETSERPAVRPVTRPASDMSRSPSLPFPETAFSSNESDAGAVGSADEPDRFATRQIGARGDTNAPRYNGARIDLDVKGADLHDVFRLIADVGKVNIVVAGDVSGTVTVKLKSVPWDQALDVVAKAKGLSLEREGNVIVVHAR
jgi:type IV pilus assembly protein PilQ